MNFSQEKIDLILSGLQDRIDAETYEKLSRLLHLNVERRLLTTGDSNANIRSYSSDYVTTLNNMGSGIVTTSPGDELLIIYMEKSAVTGMLSNIPSNGYLAVLPGVHLDGNGDPELTLSLLGADSNKDILSGHIDGTIDGEEKWPERGTVQNFSTLLPTPL